MKLFREHRGGLAESLATTIECPKGVQSIVEHYAYDARLVDVFIDPKPIRDNRLPKEWKGVSFYVYGLYSDNSRAVIGMSNFCDIPSVDGGMWSAHVQHCNTHAEGKRVYLCALPRGWGCHRCTDNRLW